MEKKHFYFLQEAFEYSPVATFIIDSEANIVLWNKACEILTGVDSETMVGTSEAWKAFYPNKRPVMANLILENKIPEIEKLYRDKYRISPHIPNSYEAEGFFPEMGIKGRWLFFTASPLHDENGNIIGAVETLQDITERKEAEFALKSSESLMFKIVAENPIPMYVLDDKHTVKYWNRACELLTGTHARDIVGTDHHLKFFIMEESGTLADKVLENVFNGKLEQSVGKFKIAPYSCRTLQHEIFHTNLGIYDNVWASHTASPLIDEDGNILGSVETIHDLTEHKEAQKSLEMLQEKIHMLERIDESTGFLKYPVFVQNLQYEFQRSLRYDRPISLLYIDLDNFKEFNEKYSQHEGNKVIKELYSVIYHLIRNTDTTYKYDSDKFIVLLPETPIDNSSILASRILNVFSSEIFAVNGEEIQVTFSCGISTFEIGDTQQNFLSRAIESCKIAKNRGKNQIYSILN